MQSIIISVNPKAGRSSPMMRAEELRDRLKTNGFEVELKTDLVEVAEQANELHKQGKLRALVGVGGDGTAAELVNRTEPGVPITLLAAGTANLLSKHFKWGATPKKLTETITNGKLISLDAGKASGRLFLVMVSCGFDAYTVSMVHAAREENYRKGAKKGAHISYFSYIKPILRSIFGYQYPKMRIDCVGGEDELDTTQTKNSKILESARWAFVFNLNRYGWGLPLAPGAVGNDGLLNLCAMSGSSIFNGIKYTAFAQCGGMHKILPDVLLKKGKKFVISAVDDSSDSAPIPYQLDGDPGGVLPVEIETVPNRVTFLVGSNINIC
ncbi:MAG: diacylglycerol/lipid kinase family protein [Thermoguttaceae bacterium]